jgi:cytochrome c5
MPEEKNLSRTVAIACALAALAAALLLPTGLPQAADAGRGQLLYENHCMVCHTSVVHVREKRKANSREEIRAWVLRWQNHLGLGWQRREIDDVTEFLNQRFYRLENDS